MKVIKKNNDYFQQSLIEIYILNYLKTKSQKKDNIFQIKNYFFTSGQLHIITELLGENLYKKYIKPKKKIPLKSLKKFLKSILKQLTFLKKNGIIHCDLKPENILLSQNSKEIKIIDFGTATFIDDVSYSYLQTRPYRAPEIVMGLPFDFSVDIWSLGCLIYELVSFELLFGYKNVSENICKAMSLNFYYDCDFFNGGKTKKEFVFRDQFLVEDSDVRNGFFVVLPADNGFAGVMEGWDEDLKGLVQGFLKLDPQERLTPEKALKHKFFCKK